VYGIDRDSKACPGGPCPPRDAARASAGGATQGAFAALQDAPSAAQDWRSASVLAPWSGAEVIEDLYMLPGELLEELIAVRKANAQTGVA